MILSGVIQGPSGTNLSGLAWYLALRTKDQTR